MALTEHLGHPSLKARKAKKRINRILFLLYCIILFLLAALPINGESSSFNNIHIVKIRLDYLFHTIIFLPFLPLAMEIKSTNSQRKSILKILSLIVIGVLFAAITEFIQLYLPYRTFNINDIIANSIGVILGLPIILLIRLKIRMNKSET